MTIRRVKLFVKKTAAKPIMLKTPPRMVTARKPNVSQSLPVKGPERNESLYCEEALSKGGTGKD